MNRMRISLFEILQCVSDAIDLVSPEVAHHHQQTACLAYRIAQQMGLSEEAQRSVLMAGIIHDVGALSTRERLALVEDEPVTVNSHGFRGARLLQEFGPFSDIADIVRYHHIPWQNGQGRRFMGREVPIESHIIHLADRVSVQLRPGAEALGQIAPIIKSVEAGAGSIFAPEPLDALRRLAPIEYVWLELMHKAPLDSAPAVLMPEMRFLDTDEVLRISQMLSRIIDFRSHFTATHSAGVAATAEKLAEYAGFSQT
ncbi:MAG: HD domain-containing protein, partial [Bacillota bacterium]